MSDTLYPVVYECLPGGLGRGRIPFRFSAYYPGSSVCFVWATERLHPLTHRLQEESHPRHGAAAEDRRLHRCGHRGRRKRRRAFAPPPLPSWLFLIAVCACRYACARECVHVQVYVSMSPKGLGQGDSQARGLFRMGEDGLKCKVVTIFCQGFCRCGHFPEKKPTWFKSIFSDSRSWSSL